MSTFQSNSQTGFSLVETLVAITILLIVIVGPMTIATSASRSTSFANEQVISYFLAQEGLELVQKGRDDLLLQRFVTPAGADEAWSDFVGTEAGDQFAFCVEDTGSEQCGITINTDDTGTLNVIDCDGSTSDCTLYYDDTSSGERSRYTHTVTTNETGYTRLITIEETEPGQEALVTSVVRWRTDGQLQEQSTTATTYLYNVYGR